MVGVISMFLVYAFVGPWLPGSWQHRGYDVSSMTGFLYQTLEGIFGTAVDVSSSLIILFTIYGAFLQQSGAGKFFLDWSFAAMGGKHTGAGRTVVLASFLLGGRPDRCRDDRDHWLGGVPDAERAGYGKDAAGAACAGGLGAIISRRSLRRGVPDCRIPEDQLPRRAADGDGPDGALLPSLLLMVEIARKFGMPEIATGGIPARRTDPQVLVSLPVAGFDVVLMVWGFRRSSRCSRDAGHVVVSFCRDTAMGLRKLLAAPRDGSGQMLNVAGDAAAESSSA
jgi:hypothetical protein